MEGDVLAVVQPFQLVAHVLEQESVLLRVHFEATLQKAEDKFDAANGDHATLVHVHDVPSVLKWYVCA